MCGIAGVFHYAEPDRPVDRELLMRITRALTHRGPDAEGFHIDGPVGLGHRRLSIVDLSPTGAQPMSTESGAHTIVYNGEFYDHRRHRAELEQRGVSFRGTSDTETLLYLLRELGADALADTAAIFGFALWARDERRLLLARDHMGVKQLYVHDDGRTLMFASEIKALLACPEVARAIDPAAINEYVHFHAPLFGRTFLKNIRGLRPGELMVVDRHGPRRRAYFRIEPSKGPTEPGVAVEQLRGLLADVVRDQLLSDVPVGAFLSGGIDSSAVAAFAKRTGYRPQCFGVHFTDQGVVDERPYQQQVARALELELHLVTLDGKSFPDDMTRLLVQQDQPVIGAAMLPMWHVARLASKHVKVCLGGQAADEIFGGYARYALTHPVKVAMSWFQRSRSGGAAAPKSSGRTANLAAQLFDVRNASRAARALMHVSDWRSRYFDHFASLPEPMLRSYFDPGFISRERCRATFDATIDLSPFNDPAAKVMHWDAQTYLPGLFLQDDRMSMAHSLESRVPLADPRLVRFAFSLPFDLKMRGGASKWVLRQAVADVLPQQVLERRKIGFDTPAERWLQGEHRGWAREILTSRAANERGLLRTKEVAALLDRPESPQWFNLIWKALCIELWAQQVVDVPAAGLS